MTSVLGTFFFVDPLSTDPINVSVCSAWSLSYLCNLSCLVSDTFFSLSRPSVLRGEVRIEDEFPSLLSFVLLSSPMLLVFLIDCVDDPISVVSDTSSSLPLLSELLVSVQNEDLSLFLFSSFPLLLSNFATPLLDWFCNRMCSVLDTFSSPPLGLPLSMVSLLVCISSFFPMLSLVSVLDTSSLFLDPLVLAGSLVVFVPSCVPVAVSVFLLLILEVSDPLCSE